MMEDFGTDAPRDDIHSQAVRAGKRTYFFDVKSTRSNELYLTITESKRRFNQQTGKFYYEKHKLFLYQEDFDKFKDALNESFSAIERLQGEIVRETPPPAARDDGSTKETNKDAEKKAEDVSFEDLGEDKKEEGEQQASGDAKGPEDADSSEGSEDSEDKDEPLS